MPFAAVCVCATATVWLCVCVLCCFDWNLIKTSFFSFSARIVQLYFYVWLCLSQRFRFDGIMGGKMLSQAQGKRTAHMPYTFASWIGIWKPWYIHCLFFSLPFSGVDTCAPPFAMHVPMKDNDLDTWCDVLLMRMAHALPCHLPSSFLPTSSEFSRRTAFFGFCSFNLFSCIFFLGSAFTCPLPEVSHWK